MSDQVLGYLMDLIASLSLPAILVIVASWRVARLRNLEVTSFKARVDESVADTIKEHLSEQVINPLFTANNVVLPPGIDAFDILETLVPEDNVQVLANMVHDLAQLGIESNTYQLLLHTVNALWGGG